MEKDLRNNPNVLQSSSAATLAPAVKFDYWFIADGGMSQQRCCRYAWSTEAGMPMQCVGVLPPHFRPPFPNDSWTKVGGAALGVFLV